MNKKLTTIIFAGIIFLASFLRLWQLGAVPVSPDWDEVALGYDAYSLLHTGRDEFGKFLPVVLRSYDDYKPALYVYSAVPAIALFGLSTFAVRLPSAIFGILTVAAVYFLVKELFEGNSNNKNSKYLLEIGNWKLEIPLIAAALMAISPWHIQFSRVAFETNLGLALNIFSVLFFIKGIKKPWLLSVSAICAALSIYAYQSEKVFTPLLIIALCMIYYKNIIKISKKYLLSAFFLGLIVVLPMLLFIATNKSALQRAQSTLVFSNQTAFLKNSTSRLQRDKTNKDLIGKVIDNRRVLYLKTGIAGYLSHFDLNWLFVKGDLNRHHAPGMGLLYLWELPFVLIGIYILIFDKSISKKSKQIIFAWFLIAPIPAALTNDVPHAVRTLNFLPTFQIFTAIGTTVVLKYVSSIKHQVLRVLFSAFCFLFFVFNIFYFLNQYFVQQNYFYAYDWQYGYAQTIPEIEKIKNNYTDIIVSEKNPFDKSYMFFLYYLKYSPFDYQNRKNGIKDSNRPHNFDKYIFRNIDWDRDKNLSHILLIGSASDFPLNIKAKKIINFPDGNPAMLIVDPTDN